jgi:hypothetical protein
VYRVQDWLLETWKPYFRHSLQRAHAELMLLLGTYPLRGFRNTFPLSIGPVHNLLLKEESSLLPPPAPLMNTLSPSLLEPPCAASIFFAEHTL